MTTDFSWPGLTGPADRAHVHDAPEGVSRQTPPNDRFFHEVINDADRTLDCSAWGVFPTCVPDTGSSHNVFDLASRFNFPGCDPLTQICSVPQFADIALADGLYLDIHTQQFPSGELRGQSARTRAGACDLLVGGTESDSVVGPPPATLAPHAIQRFVVGDKFQGCRHKLVENFRHRVSRVGFIGSQIADLLLAEQAAIRITQVRRPRCIPPLSMTGVRGLV
jgi:hypothetical protein